MPLHKLFQTKTATHNEAGGRAFARSPEDALALFVATGCLRSCYYTSATEQLAEILRLLPLCGPEFVAKAALWGRRQGLMKDTPALLCAWLAVHDGDRLEKAFPQVIDNGRMLRGFVQILRSGQLGRRSFGSRPKRLIQQWLDSRSDAQLFRASVGQKPSLGDIVRMVHPKPSTPQRSALYAYLSDRPYDALLLPPLVREFEDFKLRLLHAGGAENASLRAPDVPFELLTGLPLRAADWREIAHNAPWQRTRMNLNSFERHGVFDDFRLTHRIAARLRDEEQIRKARAFPYQLFAAYSHARSGVPQVVKDALHDAAEKALHNVPTLSDNVWICPDVSGSMHAPATGHQRGASSAMRCLDVAALISAAVLRKNPRAEVLPFHSRVQPCALHRRTPVLRMAEQLASLPSGGTDCSAPLRWILKQRRAVDLVILVSDQESWCDSVWSRNVPFEQTETMRAWKKLKERFPARPPRLHRHRALCDQAGRGPAGRPCASAASATPSSLCSATSPRGGSTVPASSRRSTPCRCSGGTAPFPAHDTNARTTKKRHATECRGDSIARNPMSPHRIVRTPLPVTNAREDYIWHWRVRIPLVVAFGPRAGQTSVFSPTRRDHTSLREPRGPRGSSKHEHQRRSLADAECRRDYIVFDSPIVSALLVRATGLRPRMPERTTSTLARQVVGSSPTCSTMEQ